MLRKARQVMRDARGPGASPESRMAVLRVGWESLSKAHGIMAGIPLGAATEEVLTRQLAVERYGTALLVRLRRILKKDGEIPDDDDLGDNLDT